MVGRVLVALLVSLVCASCKDDPAPAALAPLSTPAVVEVAAGTFTMGCNAAVDTRCNGDEKPAHEVSVRAFAVDKLETSQREYQECVARGQCAAPSAEFDPDGHADYPVAFVRWEDARAYCAFRGKRLPTEAEWEWAARGADGRLYPWGNEAPSCDLASYSKLATENSSDPAGACRATTDAVRTDVVGSHPRGPSASGALDMGGNLWEWVNDFYDPAYYAASPKQDPQGPTSSPIGAHAKRGGSWQDSTDRLRSSRRWFHPIESGADDIGIRCASSSL